MKNKFKKGDVCYYIFEHKYNNNNPINRNGPHYHSINCDKMIISQVGIGKLIDPNGIIFDYRTIGGSYHRENELLTYEEALIKFQTYAKK